MKLALKIVFTLLTILLSVGFLVPENIAIPVKDASVHDWNADSFWYEPWGISVVHKGIDIFAGKGTDLVATTDGIVLYQGTLRRGGKVILLLGPKWRLHYYAHLESIDVKSFSFVSSNQKIGTVGDTGNAAGKPAHVHYSIISTLPYPWKITTETQGWKKMFFLDPESYLTEGVSF